KDLAASIVPIEIAPVLDIDRGAVLGLEHIMRVELEHAVGPRPGPVGTGITQHFPFEPRPVDPAAGRRHIAAIAARRFHDDALLEVDPDLKCELCLESGNHAGRPLPWFFAPRDLARGHDAVQSPRGERKVYP